MYGGDQRVGRGGGTHELLVQFSLDNVNHDPVGMTAAHVLGVEDHERLR